MVENLKALIVHWLLRELAIHLNEPIQSYPVQYGGDRLWQNFFNLDESIKGLKTKIVTIENLEKPTPSLEIF